MDAPHAPTDRERLKSLAARILVCVLLTIVVPGTALLATAVAPESWLVAQVAFRLIALAGGLAGVVATLLALREVRTEGRRVVHVLVRDAGPREIDEPRTPPARRDGA